MIGAISERKIEKVKYRGIRKQTETYISIINKLKTDYKIRERETDRQTD